MRTIDKKTWILAGVMLVVVVLLTWLLRIDIPYSVETEPDMTAGYITLGDVGVYVSAMLLGGPLAAVVSAIGSLVADFIAGHGGYAFASLIIKAVMALIVGWQLKKAETFMQRVKALLLAGLWMVLGYFLFDLVIRGNYLIAAVGLPFNVLQVVACGAIAALVLFLTGGKPYRKEDDAQSAFFSSDTPRRNLK